MADHSLNRSSVGLEIRSLPWCPLGTGLECHVALEPAGHYFEPSHPYVGVRTTDAGTFQRLRFSVAVVGPWGTVEDELILHDLNEKPVIQVLKNTSQLRDSGFYGLAKSYEEIVITTHETLDRHGNDVTNIKHSVSIPSQD